MDSKPLMKNPEIEKMAKSRIFEVVRYPMHFSDEMIMNELRRTLSRNVMYYIAHMNGIIPIVTVGCFKSFVVDLNKRAKRLSDTSYNSRT